MTSGKQIFCLLLLTLLASGCKKTREEVHIVHDPTGILAVESNNGPCKSSDSFGLFYCPNEPEPQIEITIKCEFRSESPILRPENRGGDYWIWFSAPCAYSDSEILKINSLSRRSHGWGDLRGVKDLESDFRPQPPERPRVQ